MASRISVVIPAFNKRPQLELTLEGFRLQVMRGGKIEVIVVDDGSTDGSGPWLEQLAAAWQSQRPSPALRVLRRASNGGPSAARNEGARAARSPLLLFSDADMIPAPDLTARHIAHHEEAARAGDYVAVVGTLSWLRVFAHLDPALDQAQCALFEQVRDRYPTPPPSLPVTEPVRLLDPAMIRSGWLGRLAFRPEFCTADDEVVRTYGPDLDGHPMPWIYCLTGNISVRREDFLSAGEFDESMRGWGGEDWEWGYRLHRAGLRFRCVYDAISFHQEHPVDHAGRHRSSRANMVRFFARHPEPSVLALALLFMPPWYGIQKVVAFAGEWERATGSGRHAEELRTLHSLLLRACRRLASEVGLRGAGGMPNPPPDSLPLDGMASRLVRKGFPHLGQVLAELVQGEGRRE